MAEAAGLAFGVLGAFTDAVQCFEYIQLARNFDQDCQTAVLKLDVARLRLSRWGSAVGLNEVDRSIEMLPEITGTPAEHEQAKALLKQIVSLFDDASHQSAKLKPPNENPDDAIYNTTRDLDKPTSSLHQRLKQLSLKRFKPVNMANKVKWALYKEKTLRRLIEDTKELVDELVTLFPAAHPEQKRLCTEEGAELARDDNLPLLVPILEEQDTELGAAVKEQAAQRPGQIFNISFAGSQNYGLQQGSFSGQQTNHFGGHQPR